MATSTQQIFKHSALRAQFIEPSIREGEFLTPSMLITEAAVIIVRYPPINLVAPTVSGPFKIPGDIICNPGVWDGSPQPTYEYQWLADGVEIVGETELTMVSAIEHDKKTLTCRVTATSPEGTLIVVSSNGVYVEQVLPIVMQEFDMYSLTGMSQINRQFVSGSAYLIVSGIPHDTQTQIREMDVYIIST